MSKSTRALISFGLAALPVLLICLFATPYYPMNPDEQIQALYVSGRFLNSGPCSLMPYSLIAISAPLSWLYQVLPHVPWYVLMLLAFIVISFSIGHYFSLASRLSQPVKLIILSALIACEIASTFYITFTIVAGLIFAAGLVLILSYAIFDVPRRFHVSDFIGLIFIVLGYSLRPESGLAVLVLFAPYALWVALANRNKGSILRGALIIACIVIATAAGQAAYDAAPGWKDFTTYLDAGRACLDYPDASVETVQLADSSLSANDVAILQNWFFIDDGVFSVEFFTKLAQVTSHFSWAYLMDSLETKMAYLLLVLVIVAGLLTKLISADLHLTKKGKLAGAGVVLALLADSFALIARARVRTHVVLLLVVCTLITLLLLTQAPHGESDNPPSEESPEKSATSENTNENTGALQGLAAKLVPVFSIIALAASCSAFYYFSVWPTVTQANSSTTQATQNYLIKHPRELVIIGRTQKVLFAPYNIFEFETWDYPQNVLPVGGWENHTAPWKEFLAKWNLTNKDTLQQLAKHSNITIVLAENKAELIRTYLAEHLQKNVVCEPVETLGSGLIDNSTEIKVYRFRIVE